MPRNRPSSPVSKSTSIHFLSFPLEIRLMIYEHLLHSRSDIPIRSDHFKRNRRTLITSLSPTIYKICRFCDRPFKTASSYTSHRYLGCRATQPENDGFLWQSSNQGPGLTPGILATCRLTHAEASPILYRSNKLRFEDPAGLNCWRWSTDTRLAAFLQKLSILLPLGYRTSQDFEAPRDRNGWWKYLEKSRFNLAQDFPHLKGVTVTLDRRLALARAKTVTLNFKKFRECMYRLDWIQVIGLNDESLLGVLHPIVERPDEQKGGRGVRVKIEEYENFVGWKNATIWWGEPNSEAPCAIPEFTGDRRYRRRLFRIVDGYHVSYATGESFIADETRLLAERLEDERRDADEGIH